MSSSGRGPLIQRQGFVKRAPSGKLSAFKKWEKKWCVFAISKRSGPVLDFFEDRMSMESGPAAAVGRVELSTTKQVCAAIQCKVPYTFIIVTESKIVSLAAMSQGESESWISCLRRVLTAERCLQSSEEHEYEVGAAGLTRREQERLARSRRRAPTPPDSDADDTSKEPVSAPPVPPSHNRPTRISPSTPPGQAPTPPPVAPKRSGIGREPLPPPVPTSNRPSRQTENEVSSRRESVTPKDFAAVKNLQAVLQNYDESADTTYESGDRTAINTAHTLNHRHLTASLLREQERAEALEAAASKSSTLTNGVSLSAAAAPVYSKINKRNRPPEGAGAAAAPIAGAAAAAAVRPPVAARRVHTLKRIEHDFSPSLSAIARVETDSDDSSDSERFGDDFDEGTYTCMDSFADSVIGRIPAALATSARREGYDDDEDHYVVSPIKPNAATEKVNTERPQAKPRTPDIATTFAQPNLTSLQPGGGAGYESDDNIYENSKTVKEKGKPKAMPVAVPRRANTVGLRVKPARPTELVTSAPKPPRRESADALLGDENYENALGFFGTGVASDRSTISQGGEPLTPPLKHIAAQTQNVKSKEPTKPQDTQNAKSSSKASQLRTIQSASADIPLVPLPVIPGTNSTARSKSANHSLSPSPPVLNNAVASGPQTQASPVGRVTETPPTVDIPPAGTQITMDSVDYVAGAKLTVDIPLADGESSDSSLSEPPLVSPNTPTASNQSNSSSIPRSHDDDLRIRLESAPTHNTSLPTDEAPPPYTPPRLLNDTQLNNNMDCIAEGNSEDAEEAELKPVNHLQSDISKQNPSSPGSTLDTPDKMDLIYDSHPAFIRNIPVGPAKETDIDGDIRGMRLLNKSASVAQTTATSAQPQPRRFSPHTPPGSPPLFSRKTVPLRHTVSSPTQPERATQSPAEDVVLRLEDSFPKMQQRTPSRRHTNYLEEVILINNNSSERTRKSTLRKSFSVLSSSQRNADAPSESSPKVTPRLSASTDALRQPTVAEYDHVIRERVLQANKRLVHTDSSSDASDTAIIRRKPKASAESRQRRRSAPPNTLSIKAISDLQAASAKPARDSSPVRPSKERRYSRLPLPGGTLLREGKVFKAAQRDGPKNLPLKQAQTELLREEIAHSYGVRVTVFRKDVKYALFVDINNFIWVAGWNQKERPLLQNIFHIGDKIISVNNEPFTSTTKLLKLIKRADSETKFEIVLRRLPFGKAYFVHRNLDYEDIGLELKEGTSELVNVIKGSLISQQGLRLNPNKAFGSGQCHWVITEVNHRPLNLVSTECEGQARLTAVGKDVTFVVQPQDFVELLRKALKANFGWKDYLVS